MGTPNLFSERVGTDVSKLSVGHYLGDLQNSGPYTYGSIKILDS